MKMTQNRIPGASPFRGSFLAALAVFVLAAAMPALAQDLAQDATRMEELEARTAAIMEELAALRAELELAKKETASVEIETLRTEVAQIAEIAQRAETSTLARDNPISVTHLAGYAAAGYSTTKDGTGSFDVANFNPIFHFQYADRILWESELEIDVGDNGETEVGLEYSTIDIFLNDNFAFVAGKFISPIGQFRQNIHPSWINKAPSAPPGFGHDAAAPAAEVGFQLRGGALVSETSKITYSAYVGNGPVLAVEDGELHGIESGGFTGDADDEKVVGGRFSLLPIPKLEFGLSAAFGDVAIVENDGMEVEDDAARSYDVFGADAAYQWNNFDLRAEYVHQKIGNQALSILPEGGTWKTWYAQGAYKFAQAKWEGVLRYTDYHSPHPEQSQEQVLVGLNYLLTANAVIKLAYEYNDGLNGELTNKDRIMFQIAYGY